MALGIQSAHHSSLAMSLSWLSLGTEKPLLWAAFSHFGVQETVQIKENSPKKTAVYIDGYNLYYGRSRGTSLNWLDIVKLFQDLLVQRDQNESLERITIFTAYMRLANGSINAYAASYPARGNADYTLIVFRLIQNFRLASRYLTTNLH